jgi:hypothetical protein
MKKIILSTAIALTLSVFGAAKITNATVSDDGSRQFRTLSEVQTDGVMEVAKTRVKGYYKKNGTYVAPHYRSTPSERYDVYGNYKG